MNSLWLKIRIWTKTTLAAVVLLYALLFIFNNSGQSVKFWYWFGHVPETPALVLIGLTFLAGIISTLIVRTTLTTLRQVRDLRARNRIDRLERDQADIKAKAAMLQRVAPAPPAATDSE